MKKKEVDKEEQDEIEILRQIEEDNKNRKSVMMKFLANSGDRTTKKDK